MIITFLFLWALLILMQDMPIGKELHRLLVAIPVARLERVSRSQRVLTVLLAGAAGFLVWIGGQDAASMIGMSAPDVLAWLATVEASALVDAAIATAAALSVIRPAIVRDWATKMIAIGIDGGRRAYRARSRRRPRVKQVAANDDEDKWALVVAA